MIHYNHNHLDHLVCRGNSFDLEINQVRVGDGGEYRCEVILLLIIILVITVIIIIINSMVLKKVDIMGRPLSIVHSLEVMVAPQVNILTIVLTNSLIMVLTIFLTISFFLSIILAIILTIPSLDDLSSQSHHPTQEIICLYKGKLCARF